MVYPWISGLVAWYEQLPRLVGKLRDRLRQDPLQELIADGIWCDVWSWGRCLRPFLMLRTHRA